MTRDPMTNSVDRRTFLQNSALALGAASLGACAGQTPQPNVLWIIGEDFSPELGCYGDPTVSTPNIDRLASEGVRYTQACITAPICSIARSALMTGRYQTSIGAHQHRSHRVDGYQLPEGVGIFTDLFREAGYHTSNGRPWAAPARRISISIWTKSPTTATIGPNAPKVSRSTPRLISPRRIARLVRTPS